MKKIKALAIKAFNEGSDKFDEEPTGNVLQFSYSKQLRQYFVVLEILDDGNEVTTDVGIKERKEKYDFISGHKVFSVDKTKVLKKELSKAEITEY